jgi:predicted nucleic acid-binding protein
MESAVIISDTTCLIGLTNIGRLDILQQLFGVVIVTPEVAEEYALQLPEWISVKAVFDTSKTAAFNSYVDLGESSALALATETENALVIVDDKRANLFARRIGVETIGTLTILIRAYIDGIIQDIYSIVDELLQVGFRLPADTKERIRKRLEEAHLKFNIGHNE